MMSPRIRSSDILIIIAVLALLASVVLMQKGFQTETTTAATEKLNYLPSGKFLKGLALGYDEALADFLWVRTVGYFGAHVKTDRDYTWLIHMLALTTELDPRYESPYEFAGIILPSELNEVDEAIRFLEKGIRDIPQHNKRYWLQPFYLGFCYMVYKNQPDKAAHYFEEAARFPKSPPFLPLLASRLYGAANKPEVGIAFISRILDDPNIDIAKNRYMKDGLKKRLKELTAVQHARYLEKAVAVYTQRFNKKPESLKDLVTNGIIDRIPVEPFGGKYFLSETGDEVLSTKTDTRFEYTPDLKP